MADVTTTTEFLLNRDDFLQGIADMDQAVTTFLQTLGGGAAFNVAFDPAAFQAQLSSAAFTLTPTVKLDQQQVQAALDAMSVTLNVGVNPTGGGGGTTVNNVNNITTINNGGGSNGSGGGFGIGNRRMGRYAIEAAIETVQAGGDLIAGALSHDTATREGYMRAGQREIEKIPLVGGLLNEAGGGIYDLYDATYNANHPGAGRDGRFETDQTYANRTNQETNNRNEDVELVRRRVERQRDYNKRLDVETADRRGQTYVDGLRGVTRNEAERAEQLRRFDAGQAADPEAHVDSNVKLGLTREARDAREAEVARLGQAMDRSNRQVELERGRLALEYDTPEARNDANRMDAFRKRQDQTAGELRDKDPAAADDFDRQRPRREREEADRLAKGREDAELESIERVKDAQSAAAEAALRANGHSYEADTAAFQRAEDKKIEILKGRLKDEKDEGKSGDLRRELGEAQEDEPKLAAARRALHDRDDRDRDAGFRTDVEAARAELSGDQAGARRIRREGAAKLRRQQLVDEGASGKTLGDFDAVQAADQRLDDQRENEHYRDLTASAERTLLRSHGRGGEADVISVLERTRDEEQRAGGDGERLAAAKASGLAGLDAVQQKYVRPTTAGLSLDQLYSTYQERSIGDENYGRTMAAVRKAVPAVNASTAANPVQAGDGGGFGTLGKSADKLAAAVDRLAAGENAIFVLRDQ